jgi:hypothetical protein
MQSIMNLLPSLSHFVDLATDKQAWLIQASVAVAYMLFYTAYDKSKKKLSLPLLLDFLLIRPGPGRGLTWALNEWNKLISLVAISSLGLGVYLTPSAFSPLVATSLVLIIIHSTYSGIRYYGVHDKLPAISDMIKPNPKLDVNKRLVVSLRTIAWASGPLISPASQHVFSDIHQARYPSSSCHSPSAPQSSCPSRSYCPTPTFGSWK